MALQWQNTGLEQKGWELWNKRTLYRTSKIPTKCFLRCHNSFFSASNEEVNKEEMHQDEDQVQQMHPQDLAQEPHLACCS